MQIADGWSVLGRVSLVGALDHYALALAFTTQLGYVLTPFTLAVLAGPSTTARTSPAVRLLAIVMSISMCAFVLHLLSLLIPLDARSTEQYPSAAEPAAS